jgi:hypothetical protein
MSRITTISVLALAVTGIVNAGQIQIGGSNGKGLSNGNVTTGCAGVGPCVAGSNGTNVQQNYDNVLFAGATPAPASPSPFNGYSTTVGTPIGSTMTDAFNNVTFDMISNGTTNSASNNYWAVTGGAGNEMVIPVGVYGVNDVWTMINTALADASTTNPTLNFKDVFLLFNFGTTSNAATLDTLQVKLTNSYASGSTPNGQMQNAVLCPTSSACSALASGPTAASTVVSGVTVMTGNVFSQAYTNTPTGYGTPGSLVLDDQGFFFNNISLAALGVGDTNANTYLVSIGVEETGSSTNAVTALTAITLDTVVPEPSSVLLFMAGLGAIGFARLRRRA